MELYFSYYIFHNALLFYCFSCVFSGSVSMFVTTIDDLKILRKVDFLICLKMPVNFIQYCERSIADYFVLIKTQTEIRLHDLNVNAKTLLQLSHIAIFSLVFPSTKKYFVKRKKLSIWKRPFFSACIKLLLLI